MEAELYNDTPQGLAIDWRSEDFLRNTAKWGKFLAIMGFIMIALMVVLALFMGSIMGSAMSGMGGNGAAGFMGSGFFTVFYLIFALLYFFPVLYLYKFSTKMQDGLRTRDQESIAESFKNLKSLFKFMGILTLVILGFYALGMLAMLIGFGAGAMFS
ncbi:hypothetical protein I2I11_06555 [Pontibacter sp. 172403-2]|uniref:DUF5362 family protein n=1 Tax=Pontibacter rufus TaxID=2791028 RepID=UPI0018AF5714|nr:DUF5362 family protein [Pontibacter sp. 172403-2]MBF9252945.1 hypothetical protein [Pontibacter sp. 172403-2]